MAPKDRTPEFRSILSSIRSRSALAQIPRKGGSSSTAAQKKGLLTGNENSNLGGGGNAGGGKEKTRFAVMAGQIGRDINATTGKLQKLAQLAKRKTLFDDRPIEISELTYIIRQDISSLNTQIAQLQQYVRSTSSGGNASGGKGKSSGQVDEHHTNVVMLLQSRLANMGIGFKDVLELRTQNMKASKDRTEQFMHTTTSGAVPVPATNSVLFSQSNPSSSALPGHHSLHPAASSASLNTSDRKGKSRTSPLGQGTSVSAPGSGRGSSDFLALDMDGDGGENGLGKGGGGYQQMQLMEQQDTYIQSRSTAIESIESTIAELGQIFSQLAGMVAEQRETVQRIDADVTDISVNVSGAQRELLKYYASVTSNRWLMMKIFGVLIIFFLVFILVS